MKKNRNIMLFLSGVVFMAFFSAHIFAQEKEWLQEIEVRPGDSLMKIAHEYLKESRKWPDLMKYNPTLSSLTGGDANKVLPGLILKVPIEMIKKEKQEALLARVVNDVQFRKRNTVEWNRAQLNGKVMMDDAVKTFKASAAEIKFARGQALRVAENSFAVIKPRETVDEVELLLGEIDSDMQKVLTPGGGSVLPTITPLGEASEIKTRVDANQKTQVMVKKGQADVTSAGKTITVDQGFRTVIELNKAPAKPLPLPKAVRVNTSLKESAIDLKKISESTSPVRQMEVSWGDKDGGIAKIILQVAKDRAFKQVILEETFSDRNFKMPKLPDGEYYFRTAGVDSDGFESTFSEPQIIVSDVSPPLLEIALPKENDKMEGSVTVTGKTEKGATAGIVIRMFDRTKGLIQDNIYSVQAGPLEISDFSLSSKLFPGVNQITVWAMDANGNTASNKITVENTLKSKIIKDQESFRSLPLEINWDAYTDIRQVEIQVARDPEFKQLVFSRKFGGPQDDYTSKLGDGRYFKREKKTFASGKVSDWENIQTFYIDATPPELKVLAPKQDEFVPNVFMVEGRTEKGISAGVTTTKSNTGEVITEQAEADGSGGFRLYLSLPEGNHSLSVWAIDGAGNITTQKVDVLVKHKGGNIWLKIGIFTVILGAGIYFIPYLK